MAYDRQKVIDVALAEVGYLEKASASQLDSKTGNAGSANYTKYARDLDALGFYNGRKQGHAWCDVFVDWCHVQAYGKAAALSLTCQPTNAKNNCGAGCRYSMNYYKAKGQLHTSGPQPGDQIFFYSSDKSQISHTGLVYKVSGSKVYTVEGNTSGASGVVANGGGVCKKSYSLSYGRIAGYGRPEYGDNENKQTLVNETEGKVIAVELNTLREDYYGEQVETLQRLLLALGYDCGKVDGEFGAKTLTAVKEFQRVNGLTVDGIVGKDTWTRLLA